MGEAYRYCDGPDGCGRIFSSRLPSSMSHQLLKPTIPDFFGATLTLFRRPARRPRMVGDLAVHSARLAPPLLHVHDRLLPRLLQQPAEEVSLPHSGSLRFLLGQACGFGRRKDADVPAETDNPSTDCLQTVRRGLVDLVDVDRHFHRLRLLVSLRDGLSRTCSPPPRTRIRGHERDRVRS